VAPLLVLALLEFARGALTISLIPLYGQLVGGYNLVAIGTAISLLYFMDNFFRIPAGWLIDRVSGRWLISSGIILSAAGTYLIYAHWNVSFFILGAGLFGLGLAPLWPAVISGIAAQNPLQNIGEALSKVFIAWLIGSGAGMVVINYIIGQSYIYAFALICGVLAMALILDLSGGSPPVLIDSTLSTSRFLKELGKDLLSLWVLYPGMFVQTMAIGVLTPVIAIYSRTVFGFSAEQFALFLIGSGVFTVALLLPAGKAADRWGIKRPLIVGFFLATVGLILLPLQKVVTYALLVGALIGVAYALILPAWNGLMARVVSPEKMGTMWAVFMTIEGIGTAAGAFIGGKVWESFSPQAPFWVSAFVLAAMLAFYSSGNIDKYVEKS